MSQIVRYFHSASLKGEESRQVLYLMGPVGSGKSSLVERLESLLEDGPPFYAIDGCPMHEEPLHLIPRHLRKEFQKMLGLHIEGDLCPVCRFRLDRRVRRPLRRRSPFVRCASPSASASASAWCRRSIPTTRTRRVLIGSEDISKLDLYSEGDPRVLDLNGALNVGNRGVCEFIEVFKNDTEYLHAMITATQEKVIPAPGRHGMVYVRHLHRGALERGRVAEVPGRPHQRSDPRPYRRHQGAVQPAAVRRSEDLPQDHPATPISAPTSRRTRSRSRPCSPFSRGSSRPANAIS